MAYKIKDDCLESALEKLWLDTVSPGSPKMSEEIFLYIIQLWINIRTHSFTKKWSAQLLAKQKDSKKSIRKSLKSKGTEKEVL